MKLIKHDEPKKESIKCTAYEWTEDQLRPIYSGNNICVGTLNGYTYYTNTTSNGWYYISVGIGKIMADDTPVFCLSPAAPLVAGLLGKKAGDQLIWQGKSIAVEIVE
jgi:hypothetical protein